MTEHQCCGGCTVTMEALKEDNDNLRRALKEACMVLQVFLDMDKIARMNVIDARSFIEKHSWVGSLDTPVVDRRTTADRLAELKAIPAYSYMTKEVPCTPPGLSVVATNVCSCGGIMVRGFTSIPRCNRCGKE